MRYNKIRKMDISNGPGVRVSIFTQGCAFNCKNCFNPETHDFEGGTLVDIEELKNEIDKLEGQDGITFSGGDPMVQPEACYMLAKYCHQKGLNVWCYTGYTFEELLDLSINNNAIMIFLEEIDVLIDGKFRLSEKSYDVIFRGSKNQRIIDVKKSLQKNKAVILRKYNKSDYNSKGRRDQHIYV